MRRLPLTESVDHYRRAVRSRLHVPSHGGGPGSPALEALWPGLLEWDVTEQPELDDLSHPDGPIAAAQRSAADFYGAAEAFYLTGGATQGTHAAVFAALQGGGALLAARDSHRSLLGAAVLTGMDLVLVPPRRDARWGVSLGPSPDQVEEALGQGEDIRAVLVTYPSYLGVAPPLREIADAAHRHGALVIADAAHGTHFGLHPSLPPAALAEGADMVVMSMHKTGGALTQTGLLLLAERARDCRGRVRLALDLIGSSSPSYLLMVSIEQAVAQVARDATGLLSPAIEAARGVRLPARVRVEAPQDPLRIALHSEGAAELMHALALQGIRGEYVDGETALFCVPWGSVPDLSPLIRAAADLAPAPPTDVALPAGPVRISPRSALIGRREEIALTDAAGATAAAVVAPVPPGIPVLWPGERITTAAVEGLERALAEGARVMGIDDRKVWVVAE